MTQSNYQLGYARVSTSDQDPTLQVEALEGAGCDRVFIDRGVSGKQARRPELDKLLDLSRRGDTLVVWKLDRLGRDTRNLLELLDDLTEAGVKFRSLTEGVSTEGPMGKAFITIISAFAQLERDVIVERTNAGLATARARGRFGGRKKVLSADKELAVIQMYESGTSYVKIAEVLGVSKSTVYRTVTQHKKEGATEQPIES